MAIQREMEPCPPPHIPKLYDMSQSHKGRQQKQPPLHLLYLKNFTPYVLKTSKKQPTPIKKFMTYVLKLGNKNNTPLPHIPKFYNICPKAG